MDSEAMTKKSALCTSAIHALSPTGVAQTMGVHFPHRTHPDEPDGGLIAKTRRRRNIGRDIQGKARVILCRCRGHHRVSSALCGDDPSLLRRSGRNIRSTVTWRSTAADILAESVDCAVSFPFHYAGRLRTQTYSLEEAPERPTTNRSRRETYSFA